ncbi:SgcJ/EcaC family oxidoreductase [Longitalea arenae]|uniref:SgcJ/EcaC family oxidoreductase n=1 Tax=Longitalea arenae TaxID=2812558 RepID=UPI00196720D7|nr:SgcJ/EcaC family oxidoreductase [Longitalea arenae]
MLLYDNAFHFFRSILNGTINKCSGENAIRDLLARFYEGWNTHDVEKMVSVYADDIDHINVFGEWHKGKQVMKEALAQFHAGPAKNSQKAYTIEKIRFVKPDVAVVQVRSISTVGNIGTYVLDKATGKWLVVSFTNVGYELKPTETKSFGNE